LPAAPAAPLRDVSILARHTAADPSIVEHLDDGPTMPLGDGAQLADLVLGGLIRGGPKYLAGSLCSGAA
jgi:hypothetical protein